MELGCGSVRGPMLLYLMQVSPAVQIGDLIACLTGARLSQLVCPEVPGRAVVGARLPLLCGRRGERWCPRRGRCVGTSVARACRRRMRYRPSRSCLVRVSSAVRAVSLLVPALARPLPVLQSRASRCQSESILGRPCNPARVDSAAYPAVLGLQVQVWANCGLFSRPTSDGSESVGRAESVESLR